MTTNTGLDYKTEMLSNDSIAGGTYEHVTDGHVNLEITMSMEHDIVFTKKEFYVF